MTQTFIPILMYHQVSPRPLPTFRKYTVTPRAFAAQMRWLALAGYTPITLDALLEHRQERGELPRRSVIITFDDGFQDCVDYAVPILRKHGFTAMFYLVTGLMGQSSEWLKAERGVTFPLMNWAMVRQLEADGFSCGAHTVSHPRLALLDLADCRMELRDSRLQLEDQLEHAVTHLAYPFGSWNAAVRAIAAEVGYRSACTVEIGLSASDDDPLALRRVPVLGQDTLLDFIYRLRTARSFHEALRGKMAEARRRWRRTGANTAR